MEDNKTLYDSIECVAPNRYIAKKSLEDVSYYGLVDDESNVIIPFDYKLITTPETGSLGVRQKGNVAFLECHKYSVDGSDDSEFRPMPKPTWITIDGTKIGEDYGKLLSDKFLAIRHNGKYGVYNKSGRRIVNFIYDDVGYIGDDLVVKKDGLIGLLGSNGEIIIDPTYISIECVNQPDSDEPYEIWDNRGFLSTKTVYGRYNPKLSFDSENPINYNFDFKRLSVKENWIKDFDFSKCFILSSRTYAELFTIEDGIVANSRFDAIHQLTNLSYAVRKDGKWGVFRYDSKECIIPCEYDRIIFEGGHVVVLHKDDLCGAKTIELPSHKYYKYMDVDLPLNYLEVKVLDYPTQLFYGVKFTDKSWDEKEIIKYTIVDKHGNEYPGMKNIYCVESNFTFYDIDHILCSNGKRWGFISLRGYNSIPFKYDEVSKRSGNEFDVRVGDKWGVLSITGLEKVQIKYNEALPDPYNGAIVTDPQSKRKGILGENGQERVPSVYEHILLQEDGFAFVGFGGFEGSHGNFFSEIDHAKWGCVDNTGKLIIQPLYDCLVRKDGFIFAGRDGFMYTGDSYTNHDYSGVYDMYDETGKMLIGGFRLYDLHKSEGVYLFYFGGEWECNRQSVDGWENVYYIDNRFDTNNGGGWIATDLSFKSIGLTKNGTRHQFKEGFKCTIKSEKNGNHVTNYYNLPVELLTPGNISIQNGFIIAKSKKGVKAIRITDGTSTGVFDDLRPIDNCNLFMKEDGLVGIVDYEGNRIIGPLYTAFTNPINGYFFGILDKESDSFEVDLLKVCENSSVINETAINVSPIADTIDKLTRGYFKLQPNENGVGLKSVSVPRKNIFNDEFLQKIGDEQKGDLITPYSEIYWYTSDDRFKKRSLNSFRNHDDDYDYDDGRDTWDAMTDGQYGDMPDDFDGDYSFMGRD